MNLNDELLQHFMTTFYGSGNYAGDYWFVGMEEGGGNDLTQLTSRINAWTELGETELVDIFDFHLRIGYPDYFKDPVKSQRTWMQQARIVLASTGLPSDTPAVKAYQRDVIGRKTSETCLLELLPLPSPSTAVWNYRDWSDIPFLKDRIAYREFCVPWRSEHIRSQIGIYKPKVVVFLGKTYYESWQTIAGRSLTFLDNGGYWTGHSESTIFIIAKHPAATGITNAYFETIGSYIYHHK